MMQKSHDDRMLWAQFDSLEMGTGWDDTDIEKPQIMVESVYGDSHPGSWHLNQLVEQAVYGVYEKGGKPAKYYATDICDGCAQGHDGMNVVLASREALANMVEVNDSGWWVSQSMLNMDMTRTFKYNTLVGGVAGVIAGIAGAIFITIGVM